MPGMKLGTFSVGLTVKDLAASQRFYEALGFESTGGDAAKGWQILVLDDVRIGLFCGMFDENVLTFNPPDVRTVQRELKAAGIEFQREADEDSQGPAHAVLTDPDGNMILLDQY